MRTLAALALALPLALAAQPQRAVPLPQAVEAGSGRLTFWGFALYDARLWVAPGFHRAGFADHPFALELNYLRGFRAADVARRSIEEMLRAGPLPAPQAQRWEAALAGVLRDVVEGDRVMGVNRPGRGAEFFQNGQATGEIADPEFARRFFGIWLAPTTSEPALREALLAKTAP